MNIYANNVKINITFNPISITFLLCLWPFKLKYTKLRNVYFCRFPLEMYPRQIRNRPWGSIKIQTSRDQRF